jgi:phosphoglycolate phosphatase
LTLRLVIFDVDGTLVDSQGQIHSAMSRAFKNSGLQAPEPAAVREIIGLSLPDAISRLAPKVLVSQQADLVEAYKDAYIAQRLNGGGEAGSPLYPGALQALKKLHGCPEILLGIATGKSRRGLNHLFAAHDLGHYFVTTQVADGHPSKPHPSMVHACLTETGVETENAVIVGDTAYDIEMGRAAGIGAIGVGWGYHGRDQLDRAGADGVLEGFRDLWPWLKKKWRLT